MDEATQGASRLEAWSPTCRCEQCGSWRTHISATVVGKRIREHSSDVCGAEFRSQMIDDDVEPLEEDDAQEGDRR